MVLWRFYIYTHSGLIVKCLVKIDWLLNGDGYLEFVNRGGSMLNTLGAFAPTIFWVSYTRTLIYYIFGPLHSPFNSLNNCFLFYKITFSVPNFNMVKNNLIKVFVSLQTFNIIETRKHVYLLVYLLLELILILLVATTTVEKTFSANGWLIV